MKTNFTATECRLFSEKKFKQALAKFNAATGKAKNQAFSEFEFWSNKAAFYMTCEKHGGEFQTPAGIELESSVLLN